MPCRAGTGSHGSDYTVQPLVNRITPRLNGVLNCFCAALAELGIAVIHKQATCYLVDRRKLSAPMPLLEPHGLVLAARQKEENMHSQDKHIS